MKTEETAVRILPHLVKTARMKTVTTYGELARKAGVHHRAMRHGLGYVRDTLWPDKPMINAVCVNKKTGRPGWSWHRQRTWLASERYEETKEWLKELQAVWAYKDWEKLLENSKFRLAGRRKR